MRQRKHTFRTIVEDVAKQNGDALFQRAQLASRIAKCAKGKQRVRAYTQKHKTLNRLVDLEMVETAVDRVRFPGLLSVRRRGFSSLHSHHNWLNRDR